MSVESILSQMAQNSGRRGQQRAELIGGAIEGVTQLPAQIAAQRQQEQALALQQARQEEQLGFQRNANQRAERDQGMQDQASALAARRKGIVNAGLAAAIGESGDPSTFDAKAAFETVSRLGAPDAIKDVMALHQEMQPKLTRGAAGSFAVGPDGKPIEGSQIPEKPPEMGTPAREVYNRQQILQQPAAMAPGDYGPATPGLPPAQAAQQAYEDQRKATATGKAPAVGSFEDYVARVAKGKGVDAASLSPKDIEAARKAYQQADDRPVSINMSGMNAMYQATDPKAIAAGIKDGSMPPDISQYGRPVQGAIATELQKNGVNLAMAQTDWKATQKHIATMNGAQQLRLNQAINSLPDMLDSVDSLASKWKGGKFPVLNKANLALAKGGAYGSEVASVANQLDAQIADVTADLGNVYMGGNSPTDHALSLAGKSLNGEWDEKVLHDMVKLAKNNVTIRSNSIKNTGVAGASATNPYAGGAAAPAPGKPTAADLIKKYGG